MKNNAWIGYIIIIIVYVLFVFKYPYLDLKYQRELFLGKEEIPWGAISLGLCLILYYIFVGSNNKDG